MRIFWFTVSQFLSIGRPVDIKFIFCFSSSQVPKYPSDDSDFEEQEHERRVMVGASNNKITSTGIEDIPRTHHLNKSHSHFLFVDTEDNKPESVHNFRNSFEKYLISPQPIDATHQKTTKCSRACSRCWPNRRNQNQSK